MYFFSKKDKKYVCLPYLKFSDLLPVTHTFVFGLIWSGGGGAWAGVEL